MFAYVKMKLLARRARKAEVLARKNTEAQRVETNNEICFAMDACQGLWAETSETWTSVAKAEREAFAKDRRCAGKVHLNHLVDTLKDSPEFEGLKDGGSFVKEQKIVEIVIHHSNPTVKLFLRWGGDNCSTMDIPRKCLGQSRFGNGQLRKEYSTSSRDSLYSSRATKSADSADSEPSSLASGASAATDPVVMNLPVKVLQSKRDEREESESGDFVGECGSEESFLGALDILATFLGASGLEQVITEIAASSGNDVEEDAFPTYRASVLSR